MEEGASSFLFRPPFSAAQRSQAVRRGLDSIRSDLQFIRSRGYDEFKTQRQRCEEDEEDAAAETAIRATGAPPFEGRLRDYQLHVLARAREENTICYLGTGMGKTLIR